MNAQCTLYTFLTPSSQFGLRQYNVHFATVGTADVALFIPHTIKSLLTFPGGAVPNPPAKPAGEALLSVGGQPHEERTGSTREIAGLGSPYLRRFPSC